MDSHCNRIILAELPRDITWMSALLMHLAKWIPALGQVTNSKVYQISDFHEWHLAKWCTSALSQVVSWTGNERQL